MQLHDLKPSKGAHRRPDRIGRGTGSGRGKTSGRGQKGQNARSEGFRLGFEGGQMPLAQRIPKLPGFKNPFKKVYSVVNLSKLSRFKDGTKVDAALLAEAGLARPGEEVKILGTGDLKRKLTVEAHSFSLKAREAIEARGGSVKVLGEPRKIGPRRTAAKTAKRIPPPEEAEPAAETAAPEQPKGKKPAPDRPAVATATAEMPTAEEPAAEAEVPAEKDQPGEAAPPDS
jgi:large subunit ribosomal protein L15